MAQLLRILNAFAAALLMVMAMVSFAFLMAARDGFGGSPHAPWIAGGWTALFVLLACLAFLNLRRRLPALNLAAVAALVAGTLALEDPARWLCAGAALPFLLTFLLLLAAKRAD